VPIAKEGKKMTEKKMPTGHNDETISLARRSALLKLGLATVAVYAAPALLTLSDAEARDRSTGKSTGKSGNSRNKSRRSKKSRKSRKSRKTRRSRRTGRRTD
jgi:hypothetical protein